MRNPTEIIPAILPQDFAEIEDKVALIKGATKIVQIDICDGHFVPSFTWPYRKKDNTFEQIIREDEALPAWEDVDYEFDLMVDNPEKVVDDWVSAGAARVIIHIEAKGNIAEAVDKLTGRIDVGLALNIDTPVESLKDPRFGVAEGKIQFVQLMGIDHVGFQHQEFDEKVIEKIKVVKKAFPDLLISIDGGVSLDNAGALIDAGAGKLVVGSAIFAAENPLSAIAEFQGMTDIQ
jgi:ribulose-phosphate 3-epimerase